jgi:hypothetical protein
MVAHLLFIPLGEEDLSLAGRAHSFIGRQVTFINHEWICIKWWKEEVALRVPESVWVDRGTWC